VGSKIIKARHISNRMTNRSTKNIKGEKSPISIRNREKRNQALIIVY